MVLKEFESLEVLDKHLNSGEKLNDIVFQSLDLREYTLQLLSNPLTNCIFFGCKIDPGIVDEVIIKGALVFPSLKGLPYKAFRNSLYNPEELTQGLDQNDPDSIENCYDAVVFKHYEKTGYSNPESIFETFARRLHDHSITDALDEYVAGKKVVAVMGGHAIKRDNPEFLRIATLSKKLTELGFIMASGGGPGAMEATHVGAWFANRSDDELKQGVSILMQAPDYKEKFNWVNKALEVKNKYPLLEKEDRLPQSLGIPTWVYGHEPPTVFATHIAKYFANSVREEGLLAIAKHGVIFSPGSAGTVQEVFQDGAQNHYKTFGVISPMIFLNKDFWTNELKAYELLKEVSKGRDYNDLIYISDYLDDIVEIIKEYDESYDV